jgi:hypothetical protein
VSTGQDAHKDEVAVVMVWAFQPQIIAHSIDGLLCLPFAIHLYDKLESTWVNQRSE